MYVLYTVLLVCTFARALLLKHLACVVQLSRGALKLTFQLVRHVC